MRRQVPPQQQQTGSAFRPYVMGQGGQHTQAYVMRNGVYVAETPQPAQPRDPLTAAIRGTTVDFRELKGSAASISFSKKEDSDASFLRHALGKLPQFDGCSPSQVDRIIGAMEPFFLKPRETAIRNGQVIDHLYVLQSGRLQLGGANLQKVLMPGDTFGTEALDSGEPSEYTAFASGMCQLWRLHRRHFKLLQMDYGGRLRALFQTVVDQNRQKQQQQRSAMQSIVATALERKREAELLNKSLVWQEFADVPATIALFEVRPGSLGKGAFGDVKLCLHPNGKPYALKTQQARGPKVPDRVRTNIDREIQCMRDGASPFLMRFFGEFEDGGGISRMILEFISGGSIEQLMGGREKMKPLPPEMSRFYFACIISAFDALHATGWMHRDLSLKNVMVDHHGYGKLIDVGLAKRVKENEHTYTLCGTPIYYAPELIKGTGYGHSAEIWALGVFMHEMFSGVVPFMPPANSPNKGNARRQELYELINKAEPTFAAAAFSPDPSKAGTAANSAKDVIRRCLRKQPAERISIPEMRSSTLYHGFDWIAFHHKKMAAPWVPPKSPLL